MFCVAVELGICVQAASCYSIFPSMLCRYTTYCFNLKPACLSCSVFSMADKNSTLKCTFSAPGHSTTLLQGLASLRAQAQLLDVILTINNEVFQVHKVVLAACSDYFRWESDREAGIFTFLIGFLFPHPPPPQPPHHTPKSHPHNPLEVWFAPRMSVGLPAGM